MQSTNIFESYRRLYISTNVFHILPPKITGWALQKAHLFLLRHTVQPLPLPSAIHLRTETMPALTVTPSANALGSALGASGLVGRVFGLGGVVLVIISFEYQKFLEIQT